MWYVHSTEVHPYIRSYYNTCILSSNFPTSFFLGGGNQTIPTGVQTSVTHFPGLGTYYFFGHTFLYSFQIMSITIYLLYIPPSSSYTCTCQNPYWASNTTKLMIMSRQLWIVIKSAFIILSSKVDMTHHHHFLISYLDVVSIRISKNSWNECTVSKKQQTPPQCAPSCSHTITPLPTCADDLTPFSEEDVRKIDVVKGTLRSYY